MTSPGASSVPASIEPSMTVSAPAAIAFAMSPEDVTPPSAITGTPWRAATSAQSWTAVTCGTPTPATTRVVQIEPGPMPTFKASTPAAISASAASAVRMLPAASWTSGAAAAPRGGPGEAARLVLRREGVLDALLDVLDGDQAAQDALRVDDRELL